MYLDSGTDQVGMESTISSPSALSKPIICTISVPSSICSARVPSSQVQPTERLRGIPLLRPRPRKTETGGKHQGTWPLQLLDQMRGADAVGSKIPVGHWVGAGNRTGASVRPEPVHPVANTAAKRAKARRICRMVLNAWAAGWPSGEVSDSCPSVLECRQTRSSGGERFRHR